MTKKDYILIAQAIREQYDECDTDSERAHLALLASKLASRLASDNPRFDRQKFYKAAIGT